MRCSVVIPCHGGAELTRACIASLLAQHCGHELEILLVDNANDPATASLAAMSPCVRVLPQPHNLGFAAGTNVGLRAAAMPFVLACNNDTQAAPSLLSRLAAALGSDDRIGFAAPVSNHVKGAARLPCGDLGATAEGRRELDDELRASCGGVVQDVDWLAGLCLLARRDTWARLQGFDERFGLGTWEDDDLSLRARLLGMRLVIARDAFLHHEGHRTFRSLGLDLREQMAARRQQFVAKWQTDPAGAAVLALQAGDLPAAAAHAGRARRAHPSWPDADYVLGCERERAGDVAAAADRYAAFLAACPSHTEAAVRLVCCRVALGDRRGAERLLRDVRARCHFGPAQGADLQRRLGELARGSGDLAAATDCFAAAVQLSPDDAALHNWLGVSLLEQRRFDEALAALETAAGLGFALAHTNLGICRFQLGDPERALFHFAEAARLLPGDAVAQGNLARLRG